METGKRNYRLGQPHDRAEAAKGPRQPGTGQTRSPLACEEELSQEQKRQMQPTCNLSCVRQENVVSRKERWQRRRCGLQRAGSPAGRCRGRPGRRSGAARCQQRALGLQAAEPPLCSPCRGPAAEPRTAFLPPAARAPVLPPCRVSVPAHRAAVARRAPRFPRHGDSARSLEVQLSLGQRALGARCPGCRQPLNPRCAHGRE